MGKLVGALVVAALVAVAPAATARKAPGDRATVALNVLPPGQSGSLNPTPNSTDQAALYDGLTPLFDRVTARDLPKHFKSARFGLGGARPTRVEQPRRGVRILRDRWGVPHVYGRTRADVEFGAGWATAEDRGLLMNLLRGPGRLAALDAPGVSPFGLVGSGVEFAPSADTEAELTRQVTLLRVTAKGRQVLRDVDAYVAGINAYNRAQSLQISPWTRNDVAAVAALIGAVFGAGGGDEARRSTFLDALRSRLGTERGTTVWNDLRQLDVPESPVSVAGTFLYGQAPAQPLPEQLLDDGSLQMGPQQLRLPMSNAILFSRRLSLNGHPILVAGPQVGYYYPEILMELDLHGGGLDARGAAFPGISLYVLLGRGKDYAWSATSAQSDVSDEFVETLCGGDDVHYLYRGECREMALFDAGTLGGRPLRFRTTVHGPVVGYAAVSGRRVAISQARSTRGRELLSAIAFADLNTNRVRSARTFLGAMAQVEFSFNWFYADDRDIAMFSSGRLPVRDPRVDPGLPTPGTGEYEWRGFLAPARHAQGINPPEGYILNWNNRPARGFGAADDNWSFGAVHRVQLLRFALRPVARQTPATVVAQMNRAATQDLRALQFVPDLLRAAVENPAGTREARMQELLTGWVAAGASRLDRDLDGRVDHAGAAIMDALWPRLADAVMRPVLGPLVERLRPLIAMHDDANPGGSAYIEGWYGYLYSDLRTTLIGVNPSRSFQTRFCGAGDRDGCLASIREAFRAAGDELAGAQGPDPAQWRADARPERIRFSGFLPLTMRWTNRPTFQQVMSFSSHRRR